MKSIEYLNGLLKKVFEMSGLNEEFEPIIEELKDNIAERDAQLSQHGTFATADETEDLTFTPNVMESVQGEDYKSKYEALEKRYVERFMTGEEPSTSPPTKQTQPQDILEQGKPEEIPQLEDLITYGGE